MTDLTVDASVWIAAADRADAFHDESQLFLGVVGLEDIRLLVPAFAVVEVGCGLARKRRGTAAGLILMQDLLKVEGITHVAVDEALLAEALRLGVDRFLRGADALYAATASMTNSTLVSWDRELIERAGAISPTDWLDANP
ncbi:MAG: PIN domain-containing protein [Chloroflexota bacterium]